MTTVVTGESIVTADDLDSYESLRTYFQVAEERGHSAASVVVDERGVPITDPRYNDWMGAPHAGAKAWAFSRQPTPESLGLSIGTDRVRETEAALMFYEGSPYRPEPHLFRQLYIQAFDDPHPRVYQPLCIAGPVAWRHDGSHVCVLESRIGKYLTGTTMAEVPPEQWTGRQAAFAAPVRDCS